MQRKPADKQIVEQVLLDSMYDYSLQFSNESLKGNTFFQTCF